MKTVNKIDYFFLLKMKNYPILVRWPSGCCNNSRKICFCTCHSAAAIPCEIIMFTHYAVKANVICICKLRLKKEMITKIAIYLLNIKSLEADILKLHTVFWRSDKAGTVSKSGIDCSLNQIGMKTFTSLCNILLQAIPLATLI